MQANEQWVGPAPPTPLLRERRDESECFAAGTPILTPDGHKPIEELLPGDWVLSVPEDDPEAVPEPKMVQQAFGSTKSVMTLVVNGQEIQTTENHPFWVDGRGWTDAGNLEPGDRLRSADGNWVEVESVSAPGESIPVHNVMVGDYHTYFVGSPFWGFSVWSHNNDPCAGKIAPSTPIQLRTLYHYTDEAGLSGITESNSLRASTKSSNPSDVRYGNGQYVSDFAPGTKTPAQLSREFLGQPFQGKRFTHYIEIDVTDLQVIQGRNGVFVIPNDVPLDLAGRIIGSGKIPSIKPGG